MSEIRSKIIGMKPIKRGLQTTSIGSEYTEDEVEFLRAMEAYKFYHKRRFPTFVEVLCVAKALGYRKIMDCSQENKE